MPPARSSSISSVKPEWKVEDEEAHQGCILWLGTGADAAASTSRPLKVVKVKGGGTANNGMFNHPILVVSRPNNDPSMIHFLPMTSLNGQTLDQRFKGRKSTYHQKTFVPMVPAPPHPQCEFSKNRRYQTLEFENGESLEKPTYVNIRELYKMEWHNAELYWGADSTDRKMIKLEAASMGRLLDLAERHAGYTVEEQVRDRASPFLTVDQTSNASRPRSWLPLKYVESLNTRPRCPQRIITRKRTQNLLTTVNHDSDQEGANVPLHTAGQSGTHTTDAPTTAETIQIMTTIIPTMPYSTLRRVDSALACSDNDVNDAQQ